MWTYISDTSHVLRVFLHHCYMSHCYMSSAEDTVQKGLFLCCFLATDSMLFLPSSFGLSEMEPVAGLSTAPWRDRLRFVKTTCWCIRSLLTNIFLCTELGLGCLWVWSLMSRENIHACVSLSALFVVTVWGQSGSTLIWSRRHFETQVLRGVVSYCKHLHMNC